MPIRACAVHSPIQVSTPPANGQGEIRTGNVRADLSFASARLDPLPNLFYILLSGLAGAASWLCYFRALQLGDALRVAPIDRLSGAVTLILAAALLQERAPLSAWIGTAIMLVGAVVVARS